MDDPNRERMAALIDAVLAEKLSPSDAVVAAEQLPAIVWENAEIREAYHELNHFRDDEDIRSRDPAYAHHQRETLKRLRMRLSGRK